MNLDINLLETLTDHSQYPADLKACLNSRGLYNSMQFVLRLSPEIHRKIDALPEGISNLTVDPEGVQAFSTYLHETIHWWQHVGSTIGLMLSLSYPVQLHSNYNQLKRVPGKIGAKKSIRQVVESIAESSIKLTADPDSIDGVLNRIVNNYFDIEFFRLLITKPLAAFDAAKDPFFDCVGHSYVITQANVTLLIASMFDKDLSILPNPMSWEHEFTKLREQKEPGWYWGSGIGLPSVGAWEIFEGQARFIQLQYLHFALGTTWEDAEEIGMLHGRYVKAFEEFLNLAELGWPPSIDHPTVALFLLICDMAINPGSGFPMNLDIPKTFITDTDPGLRFMFLARIVALVHPDLANVVRDYSRTEYLEVSEKLASAILVHSPHMVSSQVSNWLDQSKPLTILMEEYKTFSYSNENLAIRVIFSHFLAFNKDKSDRPEFFCWPGAWMAGARVSNDIKVLFDRHLALFMDKADDDGIFPRLVPGRDDGEVHKAFETFYSANVTYDMTRQWVAMPGPFQYDYRWLSTSATYSETKQFADHNFEQAYGIHPDTVQIL